jgi:hypothetical protein
VFIIAFLLLPETLPAEQFTGLFENFGLRKSSDGYSLLHGKEDNRNGDIELSDLIGDANRFNENDSTSTSMDKSIKRLTFSNVVKVKVIDQNSISFKLLKGIKENENPIRVRKIDADIRLDDSSLEVISEYSNGSDLVTSFKPSYFNLISHLLCQRSVLITTFMYGTNALVSIVVNEVFPLWVVTSKQQGGFQFNSHQIGITTMIGGVFTVILQVTVYPKLVDSFGVLNVIKLGIAIFAIGCIATPAVSFVTALHSNILEWIMIVVSQLILGVASAWVLISVFVLINNSCYSHQRATVNGIGQTFASLGRLCGPYFGAVLFAWSETNGFRWPLNYHFVFYILVIVSIGNWCLTNMLPYSIQRRKREPSIPTEDQIEEFLRCNHVQRNSIRDSKDKLQPNTARSTHFSDRGQDLEAGAFNYSTEKAPDEIQDQVMIS